MKKSEIPSRRLASLDILRGLDLFMLLFLQPVAVALLQEGAWPWSHAILHQLDHEVWEGFRLWDLVMPLFLFMVGTSMAFSFVKFRSGDVERKEIVKKITRRFLLLFLFGMIVQGNLLAFDFSRLMIYNNTLQAIAVGYVVAALVVLNLKRSRWIPCCVALLIIYWIPMALTGDYSPEGNFAFEVDRIVLGRFRGDLTYTWIWSSLNFGATVLLGAIAGDMVRRRPGQATAWRLFAAGAVMVAAGMIWGFQMPVVKRLWTSSMTVYSAGWCFMLLGLFHYIIDCRGKTLGMDWLKIYGMNPIVAYVVGETVNFRSIVSSLSYGLEPLLGNFYHVWLTFGNSLMLFLLLTVMYRNGRFLKI